MSLREKVLVALAIGIMLSVIVHHTIISQVIFPSFTELERNSALRDMERVVAAIDGETEHLSTFVYDWASWDDSYQFIDDGNADYIDANLPYSTFDSNGLSLIAYYDQGGRLVWGEAYDLDSEAALAFPGVLTPQLPQGHILLGAAADDGPFEGLVKTVQGPLLLAARPILSSEDEGPARGLLVMAKLLDETMVESLSSQVRVEFDAWSIDGTQGGSPGTASVVRQLANIPVTIEPLNESQLRVDAVLPDVHGAPALMVRADMTRAITAIGTETINFALASVFIGGVLLLLVTLLLMQSVVISPITRLTNWSLAIGATDSLNEKIVVRHNDEIGVLAREYNSMLDRLSEATRQLQERSYHSGMAAMATGALHDVRNAINPLTLQVGRLAQQLRGQRDDSFERAVAELGASDTPLERKAKLADYLRLTQDQTTERHQILAGELEDLRNQVCHIDDILLIHDEIGQTKQTFDPVPLDRAVAEGLAALPESLMSHAEIKIDPALQALDPVIASRVGLVQVLANLLRNGLEAIAASGRSDGVIEIEARSKMIDGAPIVRLRLHDNGEGIAPDRLQAIFQQGYSTRSGKGRGAGLHWCSHLIAGMHGRIIAESNGPESGAVFQLDLPRAAP